MKDRQKEHHLVVTIDGPAGSGKSTVARKLARRLGLVHLNSGILYRATAMLSSQAGLDLGDEARVVDFIESKGLSLGSAEGKCILSFSGRILDEGCLASNEVGALASQVAVHPRLREFLTSLQRSFGTRHSIVLEGRDSGSVVFPDASFKFYLDASSEVRARRRYDQLLDSNTRESEVAVNSVSEVEDSLRERDFRDCTREVAPASVPSGAEMIDTTSLTVDDVVERMVRKVESVSV